MKKTILFTTILTMTGALLAADSPKDAVTAAAKKLAASDNYSWTATTTNATPAGGGGGGGAGGRGGGRGGGFGGGPVEGKTEKDGYTLITRTMGDNTTLTLLKGTNGAIKMPDGQWQSFAEASADDGNGGFNRGRFMVMAVQNSPSPAADAVALLGQLGDVTMADGVYSGALTEEGAKARLSFGPRGGGGGNGPEISGAKGTAKFWITDGVLTKYELNVQGTMTFNGNGRDFNRITITEIKDIGKTKVEAPDEAKKKIS